MKILVLVKQVPDTSAIKIDKETNTLIRTGVTNIINPDDLAGVEEALKLKERYGGTVTSITMGPLQAEAMLIELFAMGVDQGYLLSDRRFAGSDTWATSKILSSFIQTLDYDLIIAGYQAIDGDTAQVGPQVAEFLDLPQVTHLSEIIELDGNELVVVKKTDYELETLAVKLPSLITTRKEMNTPRQMNAFEIWNLDNKKAMIKTFDDLSISLSDIGLTGSPTKVKKTYTRPVTSKAPKVEMNEVEAAKKIVDLLYPYMEVKNHG